MDRPEHFEILEDRAVFRPVGSVSLDRAVELVTSAIIFARDQHVRKLLVVATALTGFAPPSLAARYFIVHEWAGVARGAVCVALVIRPEMIDMERFGMTVAANIGFIAAVSDSEEEALAWLLNVK